VSPSEAHLEQDTRTPDEPPPADRDVLDVRGLTVTLETGRGGSVTVVDAVDVRIGRGRRLALVGESGSGKSVTAMALMGLLDRPLRSHAERMSLNGRDLTGLGPRQWRDLRGNEVGLVQQDPLTALSPVFDVGSQVAEPLRRHRGLSRSQARARAVELLGLVGIPDPASRARDYPHQLSGGLRQRVAIAAALACEPQLLLADEPTTALDVTVQAQVLELLLTLSEDQGTGVLLITHDLALLPGFAHEVAVMYAGRIVENGPCPLVLGRPRHPYTAMLLAAQPGRSPALAKRRLPVIGGLPPSPQRRPPGCAFAPRCPLALELCRTQAPPLRPLEGRLVACHRAEDVDQLEPVA
jgi:peptide/nickel transport system ATP-binding protein